MSCREPWGKWDSVSPCSVLCINGSLLELFLLHLFLYSLSRFLCLTLSLGNAFLHRPDGGFSHKTSNSTMTMTFSPHPCMCAQECTDTNTKWCPLDGQKVRLVRMGGKKMRRTEIIKSLLILRAEVEHTDRQWHFTDWPADRAGKSGKVEGQRMKECILCLGLRQLKTSAVFSSGGSGPCAADRASQCRRAPNVPENVRMWHFRGAVPATLARNDNRQLWSPLHYPQIYHLSHRLHSSESVQLLRKDNVHQWLLNAVPHQSVYLTHLKCC